MIFSKVEHKIIGNDFNSFLAQIALNSELIEIARVKGTQLTIIQDLQKIDRKLNIIDQNANY